MWQGAKMAEKQGTITDSQIEELKEIEREFVGRSRSGLWDMMDTLISRLKERLNEDVGGVQDPALRTPAQDDGNGQYEPDETGEENPVPESQAGIIAKARQQEIQEFFNNHGLGHVVVPLPGISDQEFRDHKKKKQALFFRPATKDLSYEDFMKALGQGNHWTVTDEVERAKIGWEPTEQGYWFWAEIKAKCPRLGTSWNDLTNKLNLHLLSLEEYVIVWHTHKALTNTMFDRDTWSWLRTRYQYTYGSGVLAVHEWIGLVDVRRYWSEYLQHSYDYEGGRLAEAV